MSSNLTQVFEQRLAVLREALSDNGLTGIKRGIEREALRIDSAGKLAVNDHPQVLGSALTHPLITTDYAEPLLEFITPVSDSVEQLLSRLRDIHAFTLAELDEQLLWPLSMPCFFGDEDDIRLADYGQSNIGKMKRVYRQGLKNRYGSAMQVISGVHYNFSLPMSFWQSLQELEDNTDSLEHYASEKYMDLIRNFYRYGWLVAYLYGASPALCGSFLKSAPSSFNFKTLGKGTKYLPYATSLRLSDLGYTSNEQSSLEISFDSVADYVSSVKHAVNTHSAKFAEIGVKGEQGYQQLNDNILQIENELYAPIRAKRVAKAGQTPSQALSEGGVEYIEIRALDVNPFAAEGVTEEQIRVIDSLLILCALLPSPAMSQQELQQCRDNFNQVAVVGRKPGAKIELAGESVEIKAKALELLAMMSQQAELFDKGRDEPDYGLALAKTQQEVEQNQTYSARILQLLESQQQDNSCFGMSLAAQYREQLLGHQLTNWQDKDFRDMAEQSHVQQHEIEAQDVLNFDEFLVQYFENAAK